MSRNWIKTPAPALLDRLYKDAVRAIPGSSLARSLDPLARMSYLRKVHVEYSRRLDAAGIYVEHAGLPEVNTEEWRARDRADELRECSFLTLHRKIA